MTALAIDVIVRTHNRAAMLPDAVASLFAADRQGVDLHVVVVDNASTDATPSVIVELCRCYGSLLTAIHEPRPGGQFALNAAIPVGTAPIVAFGDDDERVDVEWLQTIRREFADPATDYIAGPVRPIWTAPAPDWLPRGYGGVLGIIDNGDDRQRYGPDFTAMATQGNLAVRRTVLQEVGPYPEVLATAEDRWLDDWLRTQGKTGYYCPEMIVHHVMQDSRVSRDYFRQWAAREGRDRLRCDRLAGRRTLVAQPWYLWQCAEAGATFVREALRGRSTSEKALTAELGLREAAAYALAALKG